VELRAQVFTVDRSNLAIDACRHAVGTTWIGTGHS
jgi:hypothetical protein